MIVVKRINVERVIREDDLQRYTEQGYKNSVLERILTW